MFKHIRSITDVVEGLKTALAAPRRRHLGISRIKDILKVWTIANGSSNMDQCCDYCPVLRRPLQVKSEMSAPVLEAVPAGWKHRQLPIRTSWNHCLFRACVPDNGVALLELNSSFVKHNTTLSLMDKPGSVLAVALKFQRWVELHLRTTQQRLDLSCGAETILAEYEFTFQHRTIPEHESSIHRPAAQEVRRNISVARSERVSQTPGPWP